MTTSETAAPPRPESSTAAALLRAETAPAPACRPAVLFDAVPAARPRLLWQAPGEPALVAVGRAVRVAPRVGPDSGSAAGAAAEAVAGLGAAVAEELASLLAPGEAPPGLRVLFTVAFDPSAAFGAGEGPERWRGFAPVEAFVPEILVRCSEGAAGEAVLVGSEERLPELRAELAAMAAAASGAGRPRPAPEGDLVVEWAEGEHRANVVAALEALRRPGLSKVVLAHVVEVRRDRPFSPAALLDALARAHPSCFPFALQPAPGAPVFLGASPERLARVEDVAGEGGPRRVLSGALAGSAPRGTTPEEDDALGRRLLASAKDRAEHAIVGEMIADALEPLCLRVERGGEPALERLSNVQHLFTPISGTLRPGRGLFDAVAALHPTPAVGGMPRERALAAIRELEREPRGLYAGVVGWADLAGRGDSAVAIRSALVDGARARLFAGGGIVPTSDPDVEVEETRLKMAAVLGALRAR